MRFQLAFEESAGDAEYCIGDSTRWLSLISGLQKEQAELKQRLEAAENDRKSQSEAEVQSLKTKINKLQKELQSNKSSKDQLEKEIAREKTR